MKNVSALLLVVASTVQPSAIRAQADPISRYSQWEHRLRDRVDAELAYPMGASGASGDVLVAFRIAADGKPADVAVQRSSGNAILDHAAIYLVSHLGRVGPIPSASGSMNQVVLKLSYGDGAKTASEAIQVERNDRKEQLANERRDRALIATATQIAENH